MSPCPGVRAVWGAQAGRGPSLCGHADTCSRQSCFPSPRVHPRPREPEAPPESPGSRPRRCGVWPENLCFLPGPWTTGNHPVLEGHLSLHGQVASDHFVPVPATSGGREGACVPDGCRCGRAVRSLLPVPPTGSEQDAGAQSDWDQGGTVVLLPCAEGCWFQKHVPFTPATLLGVHLVSRGLCPRTPPVGRGIGSSSAGVVSTAHAALRVNPRGPQAAPLTSAAGQTRSPQREGHTPFCLVQVQGRCPGGFPGVQG